jgi:hypothetical protein
MMSSTVPYPSWPKVGVRSWRGVAGLVGVLAIVVGGIFFSKYFFFLFGVGYLAWGLGRALLLALFEWPGGAHRRRGGEYVDPMAESYGMTSGDDGDQPGGFDDDVTDDELRRLSRRRRRRKQQTGEHPRPLRASEPPGSPTEPTG